MSLVRWNPEREFQSMRDAMQRLVNDLNWPTSDNGEYIARLPLDAYTTENEIVVTAAIPGADPDLVEIMVEGDTLTIRGEIPARLENVDYIYSEVFHGTFSRRLSLNVPIDTDHIEATFENGLLHLVLPKAEEVRPKVIKVNVK